MSHDENVDQPANPISRELHDAFRMAMGAYIHFHEKHPSVTKTIVQDN
jgi:hypothetical protein